jgi:hypothetical protein
MTLTRDPPASATRSIPVSRPGRRVALAALLAAIAVYVVIGLAVLPDGVQGDPKQGPLVLVVCLFPVLGTVIARRLTTGVSYPVAWRESVTWRGLGSLVAYAVATQIFFAAFMAWKAYLPAWGHFAADPALADLDALLHGGRDPWTLLAPLTDSRAALVAMDLTYTTWLPLLCLVVGWRAWAEDHRFFLAFSLCWIVLGTGLALAAHSAGPIFYQEVTGEGRFLGLVSHLQSVPELRTNEWRATLWGAYARGLPSSISAFPSMHIAMPALFAMALGRVSRRLGQVLWGFTALSCVAVVVLGWHYAIDAYAAIAGAWGCWWVAGLAEAAQPALPFVLGVGAGLLLLLLPLLYVALSDD